MADATSIWGAVSGSLALVVSFLQEWRHWQHDVLKLRVDGYLNDEVDPSLVKLAEESRRAGRKAPGPTPRPMIRFTLANHGRRDLQVRAVGGTYARGGRFTLEETVGLRDLPCDLRPGQSKDVIRPIDVFKDEPLVVGLHAVDGTGREWPLAQVDFLNLQAGVRKLLEEVKQRELDIRKLHKEQVAREFEEDLAAARVAKAAREKNETEDGDR